MKKRILALLAIVALFVICAAGCDALGLGNAGTNTPVDDHQHHGGVATCVERAKCDECHQHYGEKGDHIYAEATCTAPMVCELCRKTDGDPIDHEFTAASCTEASSCRFCGLEEGKALGHDWIAKLSGDTTYHWYACSRCDAQNEKAKHSGGIATCQTLAECEVCARSYGSILPHDFGYATCEQPEICNDCGARGKDALGHSWKRTMSYNEDEHWYECTVCLAKKDIGPHSGGVATEYERAVCDSCGQHYGEEVEIVIDWKIEAVAPAIDSEFVLANAYIRNWSLDYDYKVVNTDVYWLEKDLFVPDVPIFKWSVGDNAKYYKVYVADNEGMNGAECYITSSTELAVEHLMADTDYYWYVDAVYGSFTVRSEIFHFATARTTRTVNIEGVSNSRDIGGYITVDGMQIKQGMIYRSAKLDDITELGMYTLVNILGVKTDLDLRGDKAVAIVDGLNHIPTACPWYSAGSNGIWASETTKEEFAKTIKVFADPDNYPIIFHCSLGRDRTGTVAMVLQGLLGLDLNTLVMEYELSVFSYWGTNGGTKYETGLTSQIVATYNYINDNYDGDNFSEKVEDFLIDIGVTAEEIASIRNIMLEEVN